MPKKCELTGQKFGMLTVVEKAEGTQDRYALWKCRCDCGGEVLVNTKKLLRGTITNCGCIPKNNAKNGTIAEDLSNQRFGDLTVLYRAESKNGRTRWVCRCDCGTVKTINSHELKAGKVKSCGCKQFKYAHHIDDLTGKKFGRLLVLYPTEYRDKKSSVFWHCRCDCGNELNVTQNNLVYGQYRSCGCLREENWKNLPKQLHYIDGTCIEWLEKRKSRSDNTSGYRGVYKDKRGKYRVSIGFKGKRYHLGIYSDFNEAIQARMEAEETLHEGFVNAYYQWQERAQENPDWAEDNPLIYEVERINGIFNVRTNANAE